MVDGGLLITYLLIRVHSSLPVWWTVVCYLHSSPSGYILPSQYGGRWFVIYIPPHQGTFFPPSMVDGGLLITYLLIRVHSSLPVWWTVVCYLHSSPSGYILPSQYGGRWFVNYIPLHQGTFFPPSLLDGGLLITYLPIRVHSSLPVWWTVVC